MMRLSGLLLGALLLGLLPHKVAAQDYPNRVVRIVIPFPAGGSSDATARVLADQLSKLWKQSVIVENKPGAGTTVGAAYVASSDPDGYTLYLNAVSHTIVPSLYSNLRYDPIKSFEPVSRVAESPILLMVHPSSGINSVAELIEKARSRPGTLNYGSSGVGASPHLAAEMMIAATKINVQHVPFNGSGPLTNAVLSKVVDFGFSDIAPLGMVKQGTLKALAVTSVDRFPYLPDVPTLNETVQKGLEVINWQSILVPAGTSAEIVGFLNRSIVKVLELPEVKRVFENDGKQALPSTPAELRDLIASEIQKYQKVVQEAGIKPR
jgi:tripartite-type tricarboxylate transporter receptor subunit TctC